MYSDFVQAILEAGNSLPYLYYELLVVFSPHSESLVHFNHY